MVDNISQDLLIKLYEAGMEYPPLMETQLCVFLVEVKSWLLDVGPEKWDSVYRPEVKGSLDEKVILSPVDCYR